MKFVSSIFIISILFSGALQSHIDLVPSERLVHSQDCHEVAHDDCALLHNLMNLNGIHISPCNITSDPVILFNASESKIIYQSSVSQISSARDPPG